ncbi:dienelactone hydrolase family protein [Herbaspirillum sp. LeCh32-8]|uniref:dienelactone hydrolase family protein n=1 Tax=Herbaspirillum sp. LeCh32-8 TaxID=2821356 RepID=UPI001AE33298|nr:dienelactone hydrolase family protein [Herbaspirillum sp. LeCh32-8]MBP0599247.1 dienelactone hydrolase family protein [Herbaspirillum sp. LeCh32-8]
MSQSWNAAAIAEKLGIAAADLAIETIIHTIDGVDYENVLLFNKARPPVSGVLAVPNYFGIRQQALEIAATTVGAEHAIFVADVYGKTVRPTNGDEAMAVIVALKKDRPELQKRMNAALEAFRGQQKVKIAAGKFGACGFCFGGTAALELARSGADVRGTVSLHGALDTPTPDGSKIKGAVLVLHGVQDPSVPRDQVNAFIDEMSAAKLDWQLVNYGQAGHSFTDPDANNPGFFYHRQTARRASAALKNFFGELFA